MPDALVPLFVSIPAITLLGMLFQSDSPRSVGFATLFAAVFFLTALMWMAFIWWEYASPLAMALVLLIGVVFPTATVGGEIIVFTRKLRFRKKRAALDLGGAIGIRYRPRK